MNVKALLCVPFGHKWGEATGVVATSPMLRCKRCGRLRDMGSDTRDVTPWTARSPSSTGRMGGRVGRDGRPE